MSDLRSRYRRQCKGKIVTHCQSDASKIALDIVFVIDIEEPPGAEIFAYFGPQITDPVLAVFVLELRSEDNLSRQTKSHGKAAVNIRRGLLRKPGIGG